MKRIVIFFTSAAVICLFAACDMLSNGNGNGNGNQPTYRDKWYSLVNETVHEPQVGRGTLAYGDHTYSIEGELDYDFDPAHFDPQAQVTVTFSNIPSGFNEFKAVYDNLLGQYKAGVVAMVPMMMEIYARDEATGEKCLRYIARADYVVTDILRVLKTKFARSEAAEKDSYIQRYLPAAMLEGAYWENAYVPDEPYVVSIGPNSKKFQDNTYPSYGTVYFTELYCEGWDTRSRQVDVFLPKGESMYKLNACSSCYTQCKNIFGGPWQGLK